MTENSQSSSVGGQVRIINVPIASVVLVIMLVCIFLFYRYKRKRRTQERTDFEYNIS